MFMKAHRRAGKRFLRAKVDQRTLDRFTILLALYPQDVFHRPGRLPTLGATQVGRCHLDLAKQGFEPHPGTALHAQPPINGLLHQMRT
jgi:hypothetical protein